MCIHPGGWHFSALVKAALLPVSAASSLLSPWLISQGDYSPTAPTAPSLRPYFPSGSLISCEPLQVYHHHLRSKVHLDPLHHIVYPHDYHVWAIPGGLKLRSLSFRAGGPIEPNIVVLVLAHAVDQSVVRSFNSVTCQLQMLLGGVVEVV
jgi:hypothetical protein